MKIRFNDFSTVTVSKTYSSEIISSNDLTEKAFELFKTKFNFSKSVRLIGVSLQNVTTEEKGELSLFDFDDFEEKDEIQKREEKMAKVEKAIFDLESKIPGIKIISADRMKRE